MRAKFAFFFLFMVFLVSPSMASDVYLIEIDGTINPVVADYVSKGLEKASENEASAVIIKMDTPGGLMDSMRQIIKSMEAASIPIIVYVGESGARAASAGAFIAMASDITVMAEGTNIGAAHPVKMGEQKVTEDMSKKMTEDARAFIKSLAKKHGRNAEWAESAVTESLSITSGEAVSMNVADYEVKDFMEMKSVLEGISLKKGNDEYILTFKGEIVKISMAPFKKLLNYIANPNFAYILMLIGIYGLIYEFSNPGIGLGAVAGGTSLLLAALAFQILPVNTVGVLLIIFGVMMMVMDIWVPSYGILTMGGLVSFLIGSLTLFEVGSFNLSVSLGLILGATITTGLFFLFAAGSGLKIQSKKVTTGSKGMIGLAGQVEKTLSPGGTVFVRGELWRAESTGTTIKKGTEVEVTDIKGNLIFVKEKK
ncbi:MAG: nodulation protein NfeD [Elusimicrobiota bacterium]